MFFKIFFLVFSITYVSSQTTEFPPEISVKYLSNGGDIHFIYPSSRPNAVLHIPKKSNLGSVEISCTANYPITWGYVIEDKEVSLEDMIEYKREDIDSTNFLAENGNFVAKFTLWKIFESQSGQYICRNLTSSLPNTVVDIFVSGKRTFNTISKRIVLLNESETPPLGIYCPVTNPKLEVTLHKLTNESGTEVWEDFNNSSLVKHLPVYGFQFINPKSHEDILGSYECRTKTENGLENVTVVFTADVNETSSNPIACRGFVKLANYLRSSWLESRCMDMDSFAYFHNKDGSISSWRKGSSMPFEFPKSVSESFFHGEKGRKISTCKDDWSLMEYAKNFKTSKDICFTENDLGTPTLKAFGETFSNEPENQTYTILDVKFNGDWKGAGGKFFLSFIRKNSTSEFLSIEPQINFYPMATQQATWSKVRVNGTDIVNVTVYQPKRADGWFKTETAVELKEHEHVIIKSGCKRLTSANVGILAIILFSYVLSS